MHISKERWSMIAFLARRRGVSESAILKWRQRGVPGKWHLILLDDAAKEGFEIDAADFMRGAP